MINGDISAVFFMFYEGIIVKEFFHSQEWEVISLDELRYSYSVDLKK